MFETAESDDNAEVFLSVDTLQSQIDQIEKENTSGPKDVTALSAEGDGAVRFSHPKISLPHPDVVRAEIAKRDRRSFVFGADFFADPAWDMILDLTLATLLRRRVSVTSLCIASRVPPTTALRHISIMVEEGLFQRQRDECDGRRSFILLTPRAERLVARYFADLLDPNPTSSYMRT